MHCMQTTMQSRMMTQERLPHALDGEHGKLAPCMERALKLTGVLPACFQVNQVKMPFSSEFFAYVSVAFNGIKQFIENELFRF